MKNFYLTLSAFNVYFDTNLEKEDIYGKSDDKCNYGIL